MGIDRVLSLVGLATKAGKVVSGEFSTERAVKSRKAYLVIVAGDASENTQKNFKNMCGYYKVPMIVYGSKDDLAHAMGKEVRASMAILDSGFAKAIEKLVNPEI